MPAPRAPQVDGMPGKRPAAAYSEAMSEQSSLEAVIRGRGEAEPVKDDGGLPPVKVDVVFNPIQPPNPDELPEG